MRANQGRPWSRAEIEAALPDALDRLDEAVTNLRELGILAAETKWDYERQWARCFLAAEGRNRETREAVAMELLVTRLDSSGRHPGLARDLAANAYADARRVIDAIQTEIDVCRTMMVSARGEGR